jgi:CheY-like chemotaxis protein
MQTEPIQHVDATEPAAKPKLIIADDSRVIRFSLKKILRNEFEIIEAADGEEAWHKLQKVPEIKGIFIDLLMPNLDGYGLLERIRASEDEHVRNLPAIVITGKEGELNELLVEVHSRGGNGLVSKPFRTDDIVQCTRQFLAETAAEAAEAQREAEETARRQAEEERLAAERAEQERLAERRAEQERLVAERAEQERLAAERAEQERRAAERAEQERLVAERAEQERLAAARAEQERLAAEQAESQLPELQHEEQEQSAADHENWGLEIDLGPAVVEEEIDLGAEQQGALEMDFAVPVQAEPRAPAEESPAPPDVAKGGADTSVEEVAVETELAEAPVELTEDELVHIQALREKARRFAEEKARREASPELSPLSRLLLRAALPFMAFGNKLLRLKKDARIEKLREELRK